ncbi:hypothetical protein [Priestia megaterium]|uniref:hypothetical protein n=1 Tax=Priestia megaterium TaxID=1404 RepID=UPI003CC6DCCC
MDHETIKEFLHRNGFIVKVLYRTGTIKLVKRRYSDYKHRYGILFRRIHPFTWIVAILGLIVGGFNRETLESFKNDTTWF